MIRGMHVIRGQHVRGEVGQLRLQFLETDDIRHLRDDPRFGFFAGYLKDDAATAEELLGCAAQALYQAKNAGRNRVVASD